MPSSHILENPASLWHSGVPYQRMTCIDSWIPKSSVTVSEKKPLQLEALQMQLQRYHAFVHRNARSLRGALVSLVARYRSDRAARTVILAIVSIDVLFICLHLLIRAPIFLGFEPEWLLKQIGHFSVDVDRSYPEFFNYVQTAGCSVLLVGVFAVSRQPVYAAWALVFGFVLMDDAFSLHERIGVYLVAAFPLPILPGLRHRDTGELVVWGVTGAVLLPVLVWGFRNSRPEAVGFGGVFALIFAVLAFFGGGVDMLSIAFETESRVAHHLFAAVEDGGEMLAISLACATALLLYRQSTATPNKSD